MPILLQGYNKIAEITHLPRLFRELPVSIDANITTTTTKK